MSDVACICSAPIVAEARTRGFDANSLVEGLGLPIETLVNPRRRIPWRPFTEFAHRAGKMLGVDVLQSLAANATVDFAPSPIRKVLPHLRDSRTLFTFSSRWWGPWVFRGSRGVCETLPDGRLREVVRILPEYEACPEFLEGLQGTLRAMPRLLGQTDALVTVDHDGREAEFLISPPPRRSGWGGRRGRARALKEIEALGFAGEQQIEDARKIHRLTQQTEAQSQSLETLEALGNHLIMQDSSDFEALVGEIARLLRTDLGLEGVRIARRGRRANTQEHGVGSRMDSAPNDAPNFSPGYVPDYGMSVDQRTDSPTDCDRSGWVHVKWDHSNGGGRCRWRRVDNSTSFRLGSPLPWNAVVLNHSIAI